MTRGRQACNFWNGLLQPKTDIVIRLGLFTENRAGTVARAAEGRLRRRNSHDVVILAPVWHNRLPLQTATPVDVSAIIITTAELLLTPEELLLDRLAQPVAPPRLHKHRTCGVLAPNARLRQAVTASAGPAGATQQLLQQAREEMGLPSADTPAPPLDETGAAPGGVPVRPDARARRLAGDGPDGGAGGRL